MNSLNIKEGMLFIAADGDGIGKQVGRAVIADDFDQLHKISERIDAAQDFILHWAKQHDGIKISGGGDEFTAAVPKDAIEDIESLRKDIEHAFGYTISVGVGNSLSEAGTALLVAKLRGKDRIVHFSEKIKQDIKKAKRRVREKRATPDEYKLSEAYLKKAEENMNDESCQYCEKTDNVDPDHCKYCHDAEPDAGHDNCPYCAASTTDEFGNPDSGQNDCTYCAQSAPDADDCPYCTDDAASGQKQPEVAAMDDHAANQNVKIQSPDSNNAQAPGGSDQETADYAEMGMNPPGIPKPEMGNNSSPVGLGQANPMDNTAGAPVEPAQADPAEIQANDGIIPNEGAHSKDALQAIAQQIQNETVDGKTDDKQEAQNIDDTAIVGNDAEQNVSRPNGYNENTPSDLGLDEEAVADPGPDLSSVLKEGLDSQSDEIQKDKVRDLVGQALTGFKASKQILEAAKTQSPQFYQSSIAMLGAMIQMAQMLGLGGSAEQAGLPDQSLEQAPQENEWQNPFPVHPDHGGERKPGHSAGQGDSAQAPQSKAPIGQPIGKLPQKATKHVARTPLPPGAINAKGQKKVIDPKTGDTRFINMKQGMVQSPTGIPIKPPGRN